MKSSIVLQIFNQNNEYYNYNVHFIAKFYSVFDASSVNYLFNLVLIGYNYRQNFFIHLPIKTNKVDFCNVVITFYSDFSTLNNPYNKNYLLV